MVEGNLIDERLVHCRKVSFGILVRPSGSSTVSKPEQELKTPNATFPFNVNVKLDGIFIDFMDLQSKKAVNHISTRLSGKAMSDNDEHHLKASLPILFNPFGSDTFCKALQP